MTLKETGKNVKDWSLKTIALLYKFTQRKRKMRSQRAEDELMEIVLNVLRGIPV